MVTDRERIDGSELKHEGVVQTRVEIWRVGALLLLWKEFDGDHCELEIRSKNVEDETVAQVRAAADEVPNERGTVAEY